MFITIGGKTHHRWRAVDQDGNVLDILVTSWRDAKAATGILSEAAHGSRSVPRVLVTDKLTCDGVAHQRLMRSVKHHREMVVRSAPTMPMRDPTARNYRTS